MPTKDLGAHSIHSPVKRDANEFGFGSDLVHGGHGLGPHSIEPRPESRSEKTLNIS